MSDDKKSFDNSWEAVWQREINEIEEKLKRSEFYSESEVRHLKSRKEHLEQALAEKKNKKNAFKAGKQNVVNNANSNEALMQQMMGARE